MNVLMPELALPNALDFPGSALADQVLSIVSVLVRHLKGEVFTEYIKRKNIVSPTAGRTKLSFIRTQKNCQNSLHFGEHNIIAISGRWLEPL